jgi:peptidoglycan-associated lipoprotein
LKSVCVFFAFLLISIAQVDAQTLKKLRALGDEAFKAHHFQSAIEYYQLADAKYSNGDEFKFKLAESYRLSFKYKEAENNYQLVTDAKGYPLAKFYLALTQKMNNKYQQAIASFDSFIDGATKQKFTDSDLFIEQAAIEKAGCQLAIERSALPFRQHNFKILPSPVNSAYNDYAAFPYDHDKKIVITSGRIESKGKKEDTQLGENYTDCFRFETDSINWTEVKSEDNFDKTNENFHEGTGSFNAAESKYYFTRCDGPDCAIYYTKITNGQWADPVRLNDLINQKGTESKHPALSITGDTLFFVSNRPGGYGMNDLYFSIASAEDQWAAPKNLGPQINSKFNENSPFFLSKEKLLVFASQGHAGYGGFDVFLAKNFESKPENIGKPFNSEVDDMYFSLGQKKGFITSNRPGGQGNFDIYSFDIQSEKSIIAELENTKPLDSTQTTASNTVITSNTPSGSNTPAVTPPSLLSDKELGKVTTFNMSEFNNLTISGTLYDCVTGKPQEGVEVLLLNEQGETLKVTSSNASGYFRYSNILMDQRYRIIVKGKTTTLLDLQKLCVKDLKVDGFKEKAITTKFESIYFDFDQFTIRPEAAQVIDALAALCKSNPAIQIEIDAYTDFLGTDQYNEALSKKRGEATFASLLEKGVDRSSLVVIAKGEQNPAAPNETEAGRQLNRRVEFIVKGANIRTDATTYIIESKMTLFSLAKKYGTTVDELKRLNGLTSDHIETNKPLRIPSASNSQSLNQPNQVSTPTAPVSSNYIVKKGETIFSIAVRNNMTVERLIEINNLKNTTIKEGQKLRVEPRQFP